MTSILLGVAPFAARHVLTARLGPDLAEEAIRRQPEWARAPQTWTPPKIKAVAAPDLMLYTFIGEGGVTASAFARDLTRCEGKPVTLRINSPGGDVHEALAIYNALYRYRNKVTVYVDGIAASAASFVALAGDEVIMSPHSQLMIHEAHGLAIGPSSEMRKMGEILDKISDEIASIYAEHAGGKASDWRVRMRSETWFSDREAVTAGLADRGGGDEPRKAAARVQKLPVVAQEAPEPLMRWDPYARVPKWNGRLVQTAAAVATASDTTEGWRTAGAQLGDLWRRPGVLAENLGVQVETVPMGSLDTPGRRVLARTLMPPFATSPRILVCQQDYDGMDHALAHELAHILQGEHYGSTNKAEEDRCDSFASGWMGVPNR